MKTKLWKNVGARKDVSYNAQSSSYLHFFKVQINVVEDVPDHC